VTDREHEHEIEEQLQRHHLLALAERGAEARRADFARAGHGLNPCSVLASRYSDVVTLATLGLEGARYPERP